MMNMSLSSILAGLIFSVIGLFLLRRGKSKGDLRLVVIGVLLMGYSYFTPSAVYDWGVGLALCALTYTIWN